jgi:hypothetical protein
MSQQQESGEGSQGRCKGQEVGYEQMKIGRGESSEREAQAASTIKKE